VVKRKKPRLGIKNPDKAFAFRCWGLETKLEPVRARNNRAGENDEQNPQDYATTAPGARTSAAKAKGILQPIE
jgi:hypothetical protein